jgi:predicted nucleic acid-binding Zn ribbon protein
MDRRKEYSIQYAYAMDADGTLIHITQVSQSQQYTCPGCGGKLTPVLGVLGIFPSKKT